MVGVSWWLFGLERRCGALCRHFADGFPNLFVKDATRIRNRHVAFLASFHNPGTIFEQISVIYQLPRMFVGSFTLVLPYFPTGTAERVRRLLAASWCLPRRSARKLQHGLTPHLVKSCGSPAWRLVKARAALGIGFGTVGCGNPALSSQVEAEGDVATAFTLARILSNIPLSRGGPTSVVIFDIHALQVGGLCSLWLRLWSEWPSDQG
jgi:phosphoribosylpyrophosphate synthetase